jgi:hypothetical protein
MLLEFGPEQRQAQCRHCYRNSPILQGVKEVAVAHLKELGWRDEKDAGWRCLVCRDRRSGQFRITPATAESSSSAESPSREPT